MREAKDKIIGAERHCQAQRIGLSNQEVSNVNVDPVLSLSRERGRAYMKCKY
jgi:hypothetical protein